ncbi:MAG: bacterioferritin [Myxococcales bacterium]|nr:bacterioferritin [Myxococcales bacterium]
MKGDREIIDLLNEVLTSELTGINQYFLHGRMCENWGYKKLWNFLRHESIDEMKHADKVIARILFLEGLPNLQRLGKIDVGETVPEMFASDLALEHDAIERLNRGIELARTKGDNATRALLEEILVSEEEHIDWIEVQQSLIQSLGVQNYLAQQLRDE